MVKKFYPKLWAAVFSTVFFRYNFGLEVDNDVVSGAAVGNVGLDVRVKFENLVILG